MTLISTALIILTVFLGYKSKMDWKQGAGIYMFGTYADTILSFGANSTTIIGGMILLPLSFVFGVLWFKVGEIIKRRTD